MMQFLLVIPRRKKQTKSQKEETLRLAIVMIQKTLYQLFNRDLNQLIKELNAYQKRREYVANREIYKQYRWKF